MATTRKKITLPSGASCTIRKLAGLDCLALGFLPQAFPAESKNGEAGKNGHLTSQEMQMQVKLATATLTRCVSPLSFPDGRRLRIVDKELDEAAEDEMTIGELDDQDAMFLVNEINALSGLSREAGQQARTFPVAEEPEHALDAAPSGPDISSPAQPVVGAPA